MFIRKQLTPLSLGFFFTYIFILLFFTQIDVYHHYFFTKGALVFIYNCTRILFIFCLLWLFYSVGDRFLAFVSPQNYRHFVTLENLLLAFFAGVGIWHIVLICIGFAGFYNHFLMTFLTIFIFATSIPQINHLSNHVFNKKIKIYWPGFFLLFIPIFIFLITKGLYPAGGHDYYTHYFHFYREVVDSGSILPNAIWYHFYYCKGAALFFLSMLLTDPLAPQLATTSFIFAGAAIVFSILNRRGSWRLLPWLGAALYITFLIYTPGTLDTMHQGGWGDIEKPHEPAAVLMLAIIWQTINLATTQHYRLWGVTLLLTIAALVLISPMMAIFSGSFLVMIAIYFAFTRNKSAALWAMCAVAMAGITLAFLLLVNYLLTGIPDDQSLFIFWPFIDFEKVKAWGVLFELMVLHWMKLELVINQVSLLNLFLKIISYLRLDIWGPLFLQAVIIFSMSLCLRSRRQILFAHLDKTSFYICTLFLLLIVLFSFFIGRDQSISFQRFTTFTYAPMLLWCLLLLSALRNKVITIIIVVISIYSLIWIGKLSMVNNSFHRAAMSYYNTKNIQQIVQNGMRFFKGKYSIETAYQNQASWPGRISFGGIYPPAEIIWQQLPPKTRVWSMHVHSYCMLPDCHMEGYFSYRFSPHADAIYYGEPKQAKTFLQKENLNYFFYSNTLELTDPLPRAPLFSPEHIGDYFGIAWTDGDNTLLTWKESARYPIDLVWIDKYRQRIRASNFIQSFPYERIHKEMRKA